MPIALPTAERDQAPAERQPGEFRRHPGSGAPYVAHPTATKQPTGKKAELQQKCRDRGLDDTGTVPQLKDRLGGEPKSVMYGRPSSLGKQIENTTNLQKWSERASVLGVFLDPDLLGPLRDLDPDQLNLDDDAARHLLDAAVVQAKRVARTGLAADRGTHTHLLTEDVDLDGNWLDRAAAGEDLGIPRAAQQALVDAWQRMLERNDLEVLATEATCVDDEWRQAGTLDRIVRLRRELRFVVPGGEIIAVPADTVLVLDVKTGGLRHERGVISYWHGYAVQIASYAQSVPYDPDTDTRSEWEWPIDQQWALIAHLDVLAAIEGAATCRLVLVDLAAGREAGERCVWARQWEKRTDVFSLVTETDETLVTVPVETEPEPIDDFDAPITAPEIATPNGGGDDAPSPEVESLAPEVAATASGAAGRFGRPARAVVRLPKNPDEGASADADDVARLRAAAAEMDDAQKAWMGSIITASTQAQGSIHMKDHETTRRLACCSAVVAFARHFITEDQTDTERQELDDVLRAAVALVIDPDVAHAEAHHVGAVIGSLTADEATQFALYVAEVCSFTRPLAFTDDGRPTLAATAA